MSRSDRHNEIEINLLERGTLIYLLGGQRVSVPARRLFAFWAIVPHQILEFEGVTEYFVLTIPLAWFLQWQLPDQLSKEILAGKVTSESSDDRFALDVMQFEAWGRDLESGTNEDMRISLLEIEARLRRLAKNICPESGSRKATPSLDAHKLSRAEEMASYVAQHYTEQLSIEMIGQHIGLHPNYAMTLFQQTFGTTLSNYITQHRLSHAQRLLVTSDQLILDIAFASGFGSLSRFNEAFRNSFGCTPRVYRQQHTLL